MAQLPLISDPQMMQQKWKSVLDPVMAGIPTITEWTQFPLLISATMTNPAKGNITLDEAVWRRVGDTLSVSYNLSTSSAGTNGSGVYLFPLPKNLMSDPNKVYTKNAQGLGVLGTCQVGVPSAGVFYNGVVLSYNTTAVSLKLQDPTAASGTLVDVGSAFMGLGNTTVNYSLTFDVPILGWTVSN